MIGTVYKVQPQPPDPEHTRWFPAGALVLGVEYRDVDPESLAATYREDNEAMAEILEHSPDGGFFDSGVSIHVRGAHDGHEYLRFDVFEDDPHYHYVWPQGDHNQVVAYDQAAHGDMLDFALRCLRHRLAPMLEEANGTHLVTALDPAVLDPVIDQVASLARAVRQAQPPARR